MINFFLLVNNYIKKNKEVIKMDKDFEIELGDFSLSFCHDDDSSLIEDISSGCWEVNGSLNSDGDWNVEVSFGE